MKVGSTGPIRSDAARRSDKAKGRGAEFARHLSATEESGSAQPVSGVSGVDSLLAVQQVDERPERRARQHGEDLLSRLDEIRHGLLLGGIPLSRLEQLSDMVKRQRERDLDPRLAGILDDIELRVRVELAKLGRDS
ncbi:MULTISPECIES: flagellar assembly protein FliX [Oceanibaculum]|uniref:Class II flagellar assembly regulator n=1 Tax=Oceanibaculum indicum TaxID=526216 RepID=A0A420WP98_9PROT|nr:MULTISPECIES: flagellar assembly protein FliX [Oceanibaculum]MCH2394909.1 flagellar assembly protein FliX [Oceanibaculum sp.]RKQ72685.1 class II flagellar assembly regulator [Oceanibaculum indicum]